MNVIATRDGGSGKPDFVSYIGQPRVLTGANRRRDRQRPAPYATNHGAVRREVLRGAEATAFFINIARGGSVVTADWLQP
jgi:hypothetical protein